MRMRLNSSMLAMMTAIVLAVGSSSLLAQRQPPEPPKLTVNGQGSAWVTPDLAYVQVGVVNQTKTAKTAQAEMNHKMAAVVTKIKALGIPDDKIQTSQLQLTPVYSSQSARTYDESKGPEVIGYRATNTIRIRLEDLSQIGPVVDAAIENGANNVEGISFQLKDDSAARKEALSKAVQEARDKAGTLAEAAGVTLGQLQQILESGVQVMNQPVYARAMMAGAADSMGTQVQPGQIQIQANVMLEYRIMSGTRRNVEGSAGGPAAE